MRRSVRRTAQRTALREALRQALRKASRKASRKTGLNMFRVVEPTKIQNTSKLQNIPKLQNKFSNINTKSPKSTKYTTITNFSKNPKNTKIELYNLYVLQNKKLDLLFFFVVFDFFVSIRKYLGFVGYFVKETAIFNIGFGICVFNSILEHYWLKIFCDPKNRKIAPTQKQIEKILEV